MEHLPKASHIRFSCDRCGRNLRSPQSFMGQSAKCTCGHLVTVPFPFHSPCPENPLRGFQIAGCRIEAVLGGGSSATVYRGHHLTLDIPVAIKILNHCSYQDEQGSRMAERFLDEARVLAKINHPNVATAINAGDENGNKFIITRYLPGKTLGKVLRKKKGIRPASFAKVFVDITRALSAAHRRSFIHGDIKPDHILITWEGKAVLLDFGLAKGLMDYEGETDDRRALGTPTYMAPERARGEHSYDLRSDIYSLGATMYHCWSGRPPFEGDTVWEILRKHAEETAVSLIEVVPSTPAPVADIVDKCLQKRPEDRYQSVDEVKIDLIRAVPYLRPPLHETALPGEGPFL